MAVTAGRQEQPGECGLLLVPSLLHYGVAYLGLPVLVLIV
jgi:hypothetical protein